MVTGKLSDDKLQESLVRYDVPIAETLKSMDNEVALIVDDNGRLCGLVTDGDIRRAFLAGANMQTPVGEIMTKNPMTVSDRDEFKAGEIMALMLERHIRHLPVVNSEGVPVGLELLREQYDGNELAKAVLMAGGKGTRLHPLTVDTPKPLLRIGNSTIIDNVISGLKSSGIRSIAVSVNYLGGQIKSHLNGNSDGSVDFEFLEEKQALGTAGALSLLEPRPERAFIVMNADLMTEVDYKAFVRFHRDSGNRISVCVRKMQETVPFGVINLDEGKRNIVSIVEKPVNSYFVNAGIYMLEPEVIDLIPPNQSFDMVSLIQKALDRGYKVGAFPILEYWRDIGRHQEMDTAIKEWSDKQGVSLTESNHV